MHYISLQLSFLKQQQLLTFKTIKFNYIQFSEKIGNRSLEYIAA